MSESRVGTAHHASTGNVQHVSASDARDATVGNAHPTQGAAPSVTEVRGHPPKPRWKETDVKIMRQPELTPAERMYLPQILGGMKTTLRHMFKKKLRDQTVVSYPEEKRILRKENYRGVHRLNRDEQGRVACVACFMCETACPAHCIHIVGEESPWPDREKYPVRFDIDELRCIYCGMCEEACPVDAIELTPEYHLVGNTREEMIFDKEKLLMVYDRTVEDKPRKCPAITGY